MDWNKPAKLEKILTSDDIARAAEGANDRTHEGLDGGTTAHIFGHIARHSGANAIWHVIREGVAMRQRHAEADRAAAGGCPPPRLARASACW